MFAETGNRISLNGSALTYDADDRLTTPGHAYDGNGNELLVNGVQASYDFENHLVQLGTRDYTAYSYDADGNRLGVSTRLWAPGAAPTGAVSGTTTVYLVDPTATYARVVLESSGGYYATRYEYGDDLLRMVGTGGASSYYLYDGLGSTRQLTDGSGAVTDGYLYDAYGVGLARAGSTVNSLLFQGQQYDAASGTYYLRARYYDQNSGRFTSQDPYEGDSNSPASLHRYTYAGNDPVNNYDPSGQATDGLVGLSATMASIATFAAVNLPVIQSTLVGVVTVFDPDAGPALVATMPQAEGGAELGFAANGIFSRSGQAIAGYLERVGNWRSFPGVAQGGEKLEQIAGTWLRGTEGNFGRIPKQVAERLRGRRFMKFSEPVEAGTDNFKSAFWKEVANDPDLASEFSYNPRNIFRMRNGGAPTVRPTQQLWGRPSLPAEDVEEVYQLCHLQPLNQGGLVYDMDNLAVATPRYHYSMLEEDYHGWRGSGK